MKQDVLRLLAAGVLAVSFLAMLIVLTFDLIARPSAMVPTVVTTVVGAVVGYAASILGVQQGVSQTLTTSQHTTDAMNAGGGSNDNKPAS